MKNNAQLKLMLTVIIGAIILVFAGIGIASVMTGGNYSTEKDVVDAGASSVSAGNYSLEQSIGQPGGVTDVTGGNYELQGGYLDREWVIAAMDLSATEDIYDVNEDVKLLDSSSWWEDGWNYKLPIQVDIGPYDRPDTLMRIPVDFTQFFSDLGTSGTMGDNYYRVVEYSPTTGEISTERPSRFLHPATDYNAASNAYGSVDFVMDGTSTKNTTRYFYLVFDKTENGSKAAATAMDNSKIFFHPETDLDQDGKFEIVVGDHDWGARILEWTGSAYSEQWAQGFDMGDYPALAIGDTDNNGIPNLIVAYYNNGYIYDFEWDSETSTYVNKFGGSTPAIDSPGNPYQITIGDVDGDGINEIIDSGYGADCGYVFGWTGSAYAQEATFDVSDINGATKEMNNQMMLSAGDIDNDGTMEILSNIWTGNPSNIFSFDGQGYQQELSRNNNTYGGAMIGDVDDDGKLEFIYGDTSYRPTVMNVDQQGNVSVSTTINIGHPYMGVGGIADWDKDGYTEFVMGCWSPARAHVFQFNGSGYTREWYSSSPGGSNTWPAGFGNLDEDSDIEVYLPYVGNLYAYAPGQADNSAPEATYSGASYMGYHYGDSMLIAGMPDPQAFGVGASVVTKASPQNFGSRARATNDSGDTLQCWLEMKVQKNTGSWVDVTTIIANQENNITNNGTLNLADKWDTAGGWNTGAQANGTYRVYARLKDVVGTTLQGENGALETTFQFTIDNSAPVISANIPASNATVSDPAAISIVNKYQYTWSVTTDEPAICRYSKESGDAWASMMPMDTEYTTTHYHHQRLEDELTYTYYVKAMDRAGNISGNYTVNFYTEWDNKPYVYPGYLSVGMIESTEQWSLSRNIYDADSNTVSGAFVADGLDYGQYKGTQEGTQINSSVIDQETSGGAIVWNTTISKGDSNYVLYAYDHNGNYATGPNYYAIRADTSWASELQNSTPTISHSGTADLTFKKTITIDNSIGGDVRTGGWCHSESVDMYNGVDKWTVYLGQSASGTVQPKEDALYFVSDPGRLFEVKIFGDSSFGLPVYLGDKGEYYYRSMKVADFDNDGDYDILAGGNGDIWIHKKTGEQTYTDTEIWAGEGSYVMSTAAADFDNDDKYDFIFTENSTVVNYFKGNGDGTFQARTTIQSVPTGSSREGDAADFNEDGKMDYIITGSGGTHIYYGNGDGTFQNPVQVDTDAWDSYGMAAADFTGDTKPDYIKNTGGGGEHYLYTNNGDGTGPNYYDRTFTRSAVIFDTNDHGGGANFDVDYDGDQDYIVSYENTKGCSVYLNNGNGTSWTEREVLSTYADPYIYDDNLLTLYYSYAVAAPEYDPDIDTAIKKYENQTADPAMWTIHAPYHTTSYETLAYTWENCFSASSLVAQQDTSQTSVAGGDIFEKAVITVTNNSDVTANVTILDAVADGAHYGGQSGDDYTVITGGNQTISVTGSGGQNSFTFKWKEPNEITKTELGWADYGTPSQYAPHQQRRVETVRLTNNDPINFTNVSWSVSPESGYTAITVSGSASVNASTYTDVLAYTYIWCNVAPTTPTSIGTIQASGTVNSGVCTVSVTAAASGSTDLDNDSITYYYSLSTNGGSGYGAEQTSSTFTGVTADGSQTYKIRARAYDGYDYSASYVYTGTTTCDTTAPAATTGFTATVQTDQALNSELGRISFTWTNPGSDFDHVDLRRNTGDYPAYNTGTSVYSSTGTSHNDTGLDDNLKYYYKIWTYDASGNYCASPQSATGTTPDRTKPATPSLGIAESNCIGYWSFDDSGYLGKDYSAYGRDVAASGSPAAATGVSANAIDFDNDEYVQKDWTDFTLVNQTIEFWMNVDTINASWRDIISTTLNSDSNRFHLQTGDNSIIWYNPLGAGTGNNVDSNIIPTPGKWYHVAGTYDGTTLKVYVNGALANSVVASITSYTSTGVWIGGTTEDYDGKLDEIRIYSRALSAQEIQERYSTGMNYVDLAGKPGDSNLAAYFSFDEGGGTTAYDTSGNEKYGFITGATYVIGQYSTALSFDAITEKVQTNSPIISGTGNFSISAWIYASTSTADTDYIAGNYGLTNTTGIEFYLHQSKLKCYIGGSVVSSQNVNADTWYHVAVTRTSGNVQLYINGLQDGSGTLSTSIGSALNFTIGNGPDYTSEAFEGKIDEVKVYSSALTEKEVRNLYNSGANQYKFYRANSTTSPFEHVGELVRNGNAETGDTSNWNSLSGVTNTDAYSGSYSFYREGPTTILSTDFIPVDSVNPFYLEGYFKSYGSGGDSRLYFGFAPYDANKVGIASYHIYAYTNTHTTLYQDCATGDKIIRITNGANWGIGTAKCVAFDVDDSGNYTDLPNRNTSNLNIIRVENMGSYWEVEFNTTCGKAYTAGTKIREHTAGSGYMYSAASAALIPSTGWTKYSATVQGESLYGTTTSQWWHGTRYVKILMLANYSQDANYKYRFDNVSLTQNSGKYDSLGFTDTFGGYADDFNNADINNWVEESGPSAAWDVSGGALRDVNSSADYNSFMNDDAIFTDFVLDCDWKFDSGTHFGINFRGQADAADNGYQWIIRSTSNTRIQKRVNTTQTTLLGETASGLSLATGTWYHLKLRVEGTQIKAYIDGTLVLSGDMNDTTYASGRVGFQGYDGTQWFDNVVVTPLGTDKGDGQAPSTPGFYATDATDGSSSHATSSWSNDNTVDFGWTEPVSNGDDYYYYTAAEDSAGNRSNFMSNPGVENASGGNATGWGEVISPQIDGADAEAQNIYSGNRTQKVTATLTGQGGYGYRYSLSGLSAGSYYRLEFSYKAPNSNTISMSAIMVVDQTPSGQATVVSTSLTADDAWHKVGLVGQMPSNASGTGYIDLPRFATGTGTAVLYFDDVGLYEVTKSTVTTPISGFYWAANDNTPESGGMWVARTTVSTSTAALGDGTSNYIYVKAEDGAGNLSSAKTYGPFYIDITAPAGSMSISFSNVTNTGMYVTGAALTDATQGQEFYEFDCTTSATWDRARAENDNINECTGMSPNTQYTFKYQGSDGVINYTSWSSNYSKYTLSANADCVEIGGYSTSTWYQGNTGITLTFSSNNLDSGAITYYRYKWDRSPSTTVTGSDTQWSSGDIQVQAANSKKNYLHVLAYNAENVAAAQGTQHYGPYYFVNTSRLLKRGKFFDDDGGLVEMGSK